MAKPGGLRNFFGRVGDAIVWGKNYNPQTGQWSATPGQVMGGIGSRLLGVANPALGAAVNIAGNRYYNGGGLFGRVSGPGPMSPQQIPVYNPGISVGQLPFQAPGVTFNPNQPAQQPRPQAQMQAPASQPENKLAQMAVGGFGRDSRSGASVGSSVMAQGQAAQDMVGSWQLNNWLGTRAPQARRQVQ